MKTSEITPLPAYKFAALVKEAGFPAVSYFIILLFFFLVGGLLEK